MPKLIIDADDFGLSKAINHGIIESYKTGITTSTLLMPNLETAEHAIALAKDHPDLFIGQHTNFLLGKPCADPAEIPSLVDENGNSIVPNTTGLTQKSNSNTKMCERKRLLKWNSSKS